MIKARETSRSLAGLTYIARTFGRGKRAGGLPTEGVPCLVPFLPWLWTRMDSSRTQRLALSSRGSVRTYTAVRAWTRAAVSRYMPKKSTRGGGTVA